MVTIESTSRHAATSTPARGDRLPGFSGKQPSGEDIRLRDFYLRRNLALVFTHGPECSACREYLVDLAERRAAVQAEAADVLAVVPADAEQLPELPFPVVLDDDAVIHRRYGLLDADDRPRAAIFLVDRYGVVFEASITDADHAMLPAEEVPGWLEFIACRCS
jgi:peroxiredoxin